RRGRIGNATRAEGVKIGLVVAQKLQVFQACASGHQVVGNVEHVVRFVVGQMDFQQLQAAVDRFIESELPRQQVYRPDATDCGRPRAVGNLIVDVRGGHDGPVATAVVVFVQPSRD